MDEGALERELPAAFEVVRSTLAGQDTSQGPQVRRRLLQDALYRDWYCAVGEKSEGSVETRDMCEMLRAAHAGTAKWEDGWTVRNISSRGRVAVVRGRERRVVHVIDCLALASQDSEIRPGDTIRVVARRDSESINPGDWVTFSPTWHAARKDPVLRIYWNVTPEGAPRLVNLLTRALSEELPYFLKCPRLPAEYDRRDAVVLYFPRDRFDALAGVIAQAADALAGDLGSPVPALSYPLARGVGLAEDPRAEDQSFGTSRCSLLAEAIDACLQRAEHDPEVWARSVRAVFDAAGIPADRPWLEDAASPAYHLP